jgi:hypothetical protein
MKKKSGRAKRLKVLNEVLRLKEQNAQMENYIKVQTERMKSMLQQYSRENAVTNLLEDAATESEGQLQAVEEQAEEAAAEEPAAQETADTKSEAS